MLFYEYCDGIVVVLFTGRNQNNSLKINTNNTSVKIYRTKKLNNGSRVTGSAI